MLTALNANNFENVKLGKAITDVTTTKQQVIIKLIVQGLSVDQIAQCTGTTAKNVKFHKTGIYKALKVKSVTELVALYYNTTDIKAFYERSIDTLQAQVDKQQKQLDNLVHILNTSHNSLPGIRYNYDGKLERVTPLPPIERSSKVVAS